MTVQRIEVRVEPLTAEAFAPFGDVIESHGGPSDRANDLADVLVGAAGKPMVSVMVTKVSAQLPLRVTRLERHPLGSQAFVPMAGGKFFTIVAAPGPSVALTGLRAFVSNGRQGVNYGPGTWHHSFLAATAGDRFLILERGGPEPNTDYFQVDAEVTVVG